MYFDIFIFLVGLITSIVFIGDYLDRIINKTEVHGLE